MGAADRGETTRHGVSFREAAVYWIKLGFINFGGPGQSGGGRLRDRAHWAWLFSDELRARFDLVSWDQRGVARSATVNCFGSAAEQARFSAANPGLPFDAKRLALAGEPVPVAERVGSFRDSGFFSASDSGVLVYRTANKLHIRTKPSIV